MENNTKIIEFAEGLLPKQEEEKLLYDMMTNEELRQQFKSVISLDRDVRNAAKSIKPDKALKASVFAAAGLTDVSAAPLPNKTFAQKLKGFASGTGNAILASLASALLTSLLFITFWTGSEEKAIAESSAITEPGQISMSIPENVAQPEYSNSANLAENIIPVANEVPASAQKQIITQEAETPPITQSGDNFTPNGFKAEHEKFLFRVPELTGNLMQLQTPAYEVEESSVNKFISHFSIEFSGIDNMFFQPQMVFSANIPPFMNKRVAVNYDLSDNFQLGISFRTENFYLGYEGVDTEGLNLIIEQQPVLNSLNLNLGWKAKYFGFVVPYARAAAGITKIGPVARTEAGFGLELIDGVQIYTGAGYDAIFYGHQNRNFESAKWNINYGIKYHL